EGIAGIVWATGQPLVVSDYDGWDERIAGFSTNTIASIIGVPLLAGEEIIGVLGLAHEVGSKNTFGDEDVEYLTQFARLATLAIHNASLFSAAQQELIERNRAEQALRDSEERFRTAFFTSPDAININRLSDGLYVDINEGFTAITGFTREDVFSKTSAEINIWANPADRDTLVEGLKRDGQVNNLEARFRMKDGTQITGLMSAKIIWLGSEAHILSVSRNIDALKQAEAEILKRSQELSALNALSRRISQTLSKNEVLSAAAADALAATHSSAAFLILRDGVEFRMAEFQFSEPGKIPPEFPVHMAGEYLCGLVVTEEQPIYTQDIANNPGNICYAIEQLGLVSIALIPLFNEDGVFGILGLGSDYQRDYEQQSKYLEIMASTIAVSLRNALLFEAESKGRLEAETMRRATAVLTTSLDLKQVLENILDGLLVVVPYDSTSLFIFEAEGQRMVAGRGLPRADQLVGCIYPLDDAFTPIVIETRRPLIIPDVSVDLNFERWGEVAYIRGWMVIPLVVRDQV
ncbi:MAG: GAF domain-containing protein, partial [Anaerolineae bacterium]|nr:GAF domain-containing protein [Anaerolineae bacterium]